MSSEINIWKKKAWCVKKYKRLKLGEKQTKFNGMSARSIDKSYFTHKIAKKNFYLDWTTKKDGRFGSHQMAIQYSVHCSNYRHIWYYRMCLWLFQCIELLHVYLRHFPILAVIVAVVKMLILQEQLSSVSVKPMTTFKYTTQSLCICIKIVSTLF